mmetsp:Transcript_870/g.2092  ORF Transcript_870/g.2092 Transcript_870/m.2092 type:complete len:2430 (-) Transcript_870:30-7319(-)
MIKFPEDILPRGLSQVINVYKKNKVRLAPIFEDKGDETLRFGDTIYVCEGAVNLANRGMPVLKAIKAEGICNKAVGFQDLLLQDRNLRLSLFTIEIHIKVQEKLESAREIQKSKVGTPVRFGDCLQLRHLHSQGFLKLELNESSTDVRDFKVFISETEGTRLQIEPSGKHIQTGEQVTYYDSFILACEIYEAKAYLHFFSEIQQLQASPVKFDTLWHFRQFMPHLKNPELIIYGSPITIEASGDLKLSCNEGTELSFRDESSSYHYYWMFERVDDLRGGKLRADDKVSLFNLTLKKYLAVKDNRLTLVDDPQSAQTFEIITSQGEFVKSGHISALKTHEDFYVTKDFDPNMPEVSQIMDMNSSLRIAPKFKGTIKLAPAERLKKKNCFTFNNSDKSQVSFFLQVAEIVPYFNDLLSQLTRLDTPGGATRGEEYYTSLFETITYCRLACKYLAKCLESKQGNSELEIRQNFLLNSKIHISLLHICDRLRTARHDLKILSQVGKLLQAIYELLRLMTYQNILVCESFIESDSIIKNLIMSHPNEAGKFAIQVYQQSQYAGKDPRENLTEWVSLLTTISEENIDSQRCFIEAMISMCFNDNEYFPPYQNTTAEVLYFSSVCFPPFKLELIGNCPCVSFTYREADTPHEIFETMNPLLKRFSRSEVNHFWVSLQEINMRAMNSYIEYIYQGMLLIAVTCPDPTGQIADYVRESLGFSYELLIEILINTEIHPLIRSASAKLCSQLYVVNLDIPSFMDVTSKNRCFNVQDLHLYVQRKVEFDFLRSWLVEFWLSERDYLTEPSYSRESKLILCESVLELCFNMLDSYQFDLPEVTQLNAATAPLLDTLVETEQVTPWSEVFEESIQATYSQNMHSLIYEILRFRLLVEKRSEYEEILKALKDIAVETAEKELEPEDNESDLSDDSDNFSLSKKKKKVVDVPPLAIGASDLKFVKLLFSKKMLETKAYQLLIKLQKHVMVPQMHMLKSLSKVEFISSPEVIELNEKIIAANSYIRRRAHWEPILSSELKLGPSSSIASKMLEVMETLCNCYSYRTAQYEYLVKVQSTMRNSRVYRSVVVLWEFLTTMPKTEETWDLTRLCAVFCYYFVLKNPMNKKLMIKLIHPSMFTYEIEVVPYLVRTIQEFSEFNNSIVESLVDRILEGVFREEIPMSGLHWLHALMFPYSSTVPNPTYQSLVIKGVMDRISDKIKSEHMLNPQILFNPQGIFSSHSELEPKPELMRAILPLLSRASLDSIPGILQLRKLMSFKRLLGFARNYRDYVEGLRGVLEFATNVYFMTVDNLPMPNIKERDIVEFLDILQKHTFEAVHDIEGLLHIARSGFYEFVYPKDRDCLVEVQRHKANSFNVECWRLIGEGDIWSYSSGLVVTLPVLITFASKSAEPMKDLEQKITVFEKALSQLCVDIETAANENPDLDFSVMVKHLTHYETFRRRGTLRYRTSARIFYPEEEIKQKQVLTEYCSRNEDLLPADAKDYATTLALLIKKHELFENLELPQFGEIDVKAAGEALEKLYIVFRQVSQVRLYYDIMSKLLIKDGLGLNNFNKVLWSSNLVEETLKQLLQRDSIGEAFQAANLLRDICGRQTRSFQLQFLSLIHEKDYADFFILIRESLISLRVGLFSAQKAGRATRYFALFNTENRVNYNEESDLSVINFSSILLRIIQSCCDNCCLEFQNYCHLQSFKDTVLLRQTDLVSEVRNLVVDLASHKELYASNGIKVLKFALEVLIDFVTGPCDENQNFLGGSPNLIIALNTVVENTCSRDINEFFTSDRTMVYAHCIKLLLALLEGDRVNTPALKNVRTFLSISKLIEEAHKIYNRCIKGAERLHALQNISEDEGEVEEETISPASSYFAGIGVDIVILLLTLHEDFKQNVELTNFLKADYKGTKFKLWIEKFYRPYIEHSLPDECINYYLAYIGYVEISYNKRIQRCYFPIPYKVKFLSHYSKRAFIERVDRTSKSTLNKDFLDRMIIGYREVDHQQKLARNNVLKMLCNTWGGFWLLSFYASLATNLALLAVIDDPDQLRLEGKTGNADTYLSVTGPAIIIFLTAFLGQMLYMIAYAPVIAQKKLLRKPPYTIAKYRQTSHNDSILMRKITAFSIQQLNDEYLNMSNKEYIKILLNDRSFTYFLIYMATCGLVFFNPIFYSFTLLSFIFMSKNVTSILKSITMSLGTLLRTGILGMACINIFATIAVYTYQNLEFFQNTDDKDTNFATYCDDLFNCFFSIVDYGIRTGGGIGEAMRSPLHGESYGGRVFYDLAFFIVVIVIMLKIIFGIILDNFGQLRDANQEHDRITNFKCYICDHDRSKLQLHGRGWAYHFMKEHSIYSYFAFFVYIMDKDIYECNGIEKHVKECIAKNSTEFLPRTSRYLQRKAPSEMSKPHEEETNKVEENKEKEVVKEEEKEEVDKASEKERKSEFGRAA